MTTPAIPSNDGKANANPGAKSESLARIVIVGLLLGAATSLGLTLTARAEQPSAHATTTTAVSALPPLERPEKNDRIVTTNGDVTPVGMAGIVDTLTKGGPVADPGGFTPKPRSAALFHRMVDGPMTLRVYTASGSPESVMTAYGKDLEAAGFEREDTAENAKRPASARRAAEEGKEGKEDKSESKDDKPNARGRLKRFYAKQDFESLITVARAEQQNQVLVTIVEQPKRGDQ